jgi:hypothetical protein
MKPLIVLEPRTSLDPQICSYLKDRLPHAPFATGNPKISQCQSGFRLRHQNIRVPDRRLSMRTRECTRGFRTRASPSVGCRPSSALRLCRTGDSPPCLALRRRGPVLWPGIWQAAGTGVRPRILLTNQNRRPPRVTWMDRRRKVCQIRVVSGSYLSSEQPRIGVSSR